MTITQSAASAPHHEALRSSAMPAEPRKGTPWLLAFLCFLIPALPSFIVLPGPLKSNGSPARMIAVLFFGLTILGFILIRRTATTRTVRPGVALILLYFLLQLLIFGVGITRLDGTIVESSKTRWMIMMTAYTGVALYAMTRVETERQCTIVLGCLTIGLTFACVVGLLQKTGIDLRYLFQPPGFVVNAEDLGLSDRLGSTRAMATSGHAIEFSVLAAVTVPMTLHFARCAASRPVRWLALLAFGLALLAVPAAVSRTGAVCLAAALCVYLWNFKVRELAVAVVCGAVWVVAYIATFPSTANALWETIVRSEQDESVHGRTADYATVSETFRAHPVFGLGLGATPPTEYGFLDNEWLQAIVQGGIVGATAIIVLAAGGIFGISAALRTAATRRERDRAYAMGSAFVAILASSFTFDLFSYQQATLIFFILFGLLWSKFKIPLPEAIGTSRSPHYGAE
jgi:O-antigen ligase